MNYGIDSNILIKFVLFNDLYMKKVFSNLWTVLVCGAAALISFASCESSINEDYDLTKDIDMTINLLQGLEAPAGNVSKVSITDLLGMEIADTDLVAIDGNGDLSIQYGDTGEFEIDEIDFGTWERKTFDPINVTFPLSRINLSGIPQSGISLSYSELTGKQFSASTSTDFEAELPEEVTDVRYVDFHTELTLKFSTTGGKVYMKSGMKIEFPEYISIQNYYQHPEFTVENDNTIVLLQDVPTPAELTFFLNRVNLPEGAVIDRKIDMDIELNIEGDVFIYTDEFVDLSNDIDIIVSVNDFILKPANASLRIDADFEPEDIELQTPQLPDFLTGEDTCLDLLCAPSLYLTVNNWTKFEFGLQAQITAHHSSLSPSVSLGTDPQILIKSESDNKYLISSEKQDVDADVVNIVRPSLKDMFKEIPERISIDDMKLNFTDDYFDFNLGVGYLIQYDYMLKLPLTFGDALNIQYTFDVDTYNLNLEAGITDANLNFELVNSIPMTFDLEVEALDYENNPVEWLKFDLDAKIASGTQDAPVTSPVSLNFKSERNLIKFAGLRFRFKGTAPSSEHLGVSLNQNQGIELKSLKLSLPEGITINPDIL